MSDPYEPFRDEPRRDAPHGADTGVGDDVEHTRPLAHGDGTGDAAGGGQHAAPQPSGWGDQHAGYPAPGQQAGGLPARPGPQDGYAAFGAPVPAPGEGRRDRRRAERDRRRADRAGRGRVPGWVWPAVTALALVVGLGGGALGAAAYDAWQDDDAPRATSSGLGIEGEGVSTAPPLEAGNTSVAAVAAELLPSTLQIFSSADGEDATGSGFVFDEAGHIITNNHVVAEAAEGGTVEVLTDDGQRFAVEVVGRSAVYDIAVLQADEAQDLQAVSFGPAADLVVGEGVVAIGSPLGLSATVTHGIVSAKNRPVTTGSSDDQSYINAVQTDAAINPGNSGGPLVDLEGRVVGVNSAIATTGGMTGSGGSIGVGFAIPSEQVLRTAEQLIQDGEASYPVIGAQVMVGGEDTGRGAVVDQINDGSPAQEAGLQEGDVVTAVNDQPVTGGAELIVAIRSYAPGETITLTVQRGEDISEVDVTLDAQTG
ncbi:S1C family serine protease [Nocardioides sp. CPCC 205120]|uniref:S1C family serine protease n=1 Tax=Nocardioides sp. CPCC 205120 TaxID=3406462 RepID=UPI003B5143B5